jgi:hypothetical protein
VNIRSWLFLCNVIAAVVDWIEIDRIFRHKQTPVEFVGVGLGIWLLPFAVRRFANTRSR